jgi:pimeloyl-ACP methyl ester carboxylesterase
MDELPITRYALSGEVSIAYQVMGDGPVDIILIPGFMSHIEFQHELAGWTTSLRRLSKFARVVTFDKRGQGLSDRISDAPSLEQRMDDVRAVMDAVGSKRATLFGHSEGCAMSVLFAAALSRELNLVAPRLEVRAQVQAAVAARHVRNASSLRTRSVRREVRWRWTLNGLWTAA